MRASFQMKLVQARRNAVGPMVQSTGGEKSGGRRCSPNARKSIVGDELVPNIRSGIRLELK